MYTYGEILDHWTDCRDFVEPSKQRLKRLHLVDNVRDLAQHIDSQIDGLIDRWSLPV